MKPEVEQAVVLGTLPKLVCIHSTEAPFFPWFKIRADASAQTDKLKLRLEIQDGSAHAANADRDRGEGQYEPTIGRSGT
jgi:hypothetical protein